MQNPFIEISGRKIGVDFPPLVIAEIGINHEGSLAVAKEMDKSLWAPNVPAFTLKILFGEMSGVILEGSRVSGEKITREGFSFEYPKVEAALKNLL